MREFAGYVQDTWRATANLTLTAGVRWDRQGAIQNLDNLYTRPGFRRIVRRLGRGQSLQTGRADGQRAGVLAGASGRRRIRSGRWPLQPDLSESPTASPWRLHALADGRRFGVARRLQRLHQSPGHRLPGWRVERQSGPQPEHDRQRRRQLPTSSPRAACCSARFAPSRR